MNPDKAPVADPLADLVDEQLKQLLKACSMLRYPPKSELKNKMVKFGPKMRQKLLILDMDETMLHTKFFNVTDTSEKPKPPEMHDGVMEFTAHLNCTDSAGRRQVLGLNIKIRQYLEDVLQYLAGMYEICVFTAGE